MSREKKSALPVLNCHTCGGQCCRYFALQIDTPRTAEDFDNLRWYIAHQQVAVFVEGRNWFLQVNNPCRHLNPDHGCDIYEVRPKICRDYGWDPSGDSECHGTDKPCDHDAFFATLEELEAYLLKKGKKWSSMKNARASK